jgi:hypothetical protein
MKQTFQLAFLTLVAVVGQTAVVEAAGITGVTKGSYDLRMPPTTPTGDTWYYATGMPLQLDATTAALLVNIRRNGTPYNDYEAGTDLVVFNSLSNISASKAIPISRPRKEPNPETGQLSLTSEYPMYGGFVPRGAAIDNNAPHPYGGTGFGIHYVGFYPADTSQTFPNPVVYRLEIQQFRYDGNEFTAGEPVRLSASGLRVGDTDWYIAAPGFSPAIPDGNDLLFGVTCCGKDNNFVNGINGVARFQYGSGGWQPTSFVPISYSGYEPSLIRDVDGSLLFANRRDESFRLWRSTNGGDWDQLFVAGSRLSVPLVLNQALDGTPYFTANAANDDPARDRLQIVPVNSTRTGLDAPLVVMDGTDEFGPSPNGQGWDVDHGYSNVVRLGDGRWHSVLGHRVMARTEHFNASLGAPCTGFYVEEVSSSGDPRPMWTFVAPEPSSGVMAVFTVASIVGFLSIKRAWSERFASVRRGKEACLGFLRNWRTRC